MKKTHKSATQQKHNSCYQSRAQKKKNHLTERLNYFISLTLHLRWRQGQTLLLMKHAFSKILLLLTALPLLLLSCKKYEDLQVNPNEPSTATPSLLLTNICISVFNYDPTYPAYAARHLTYYERGNSAVDYSWTSGEYSNFDVLRQVEKMDELAQQNGAVNYTGLAKFFRAVLFSQLTEQFGDIPYSDALGATDGNTKPLYDTQEAVYAGILNELEEANNILDDASGTIGGDIIYGGVASQWKKLVNAFRLRLLIHLSKKEGNSSINIKEQFQNIVSNPSQYPLMESGDDNGQLVFNESATSNYYPTCGSLSVGTAVSIEEGFANILKERSDPRLFSFADPITGLPANIFDNYAGVNAGLTVADQQTVSANASRINRRYPDINNPVNEPLILMGYPEQEFVIAEGIARGWVTGSGEDHYENGIAASMAFYNIEVPAGYLDQPNVKYDAANAIEFIIIQKYIALFMQSGWEAFYEQRRTGIPHLNTGPGTYNDGRVPKRWLYPQSEYDYNAANVESAIRNQFTDDDVNEAIWLIE